MLADRAKFLKVNVDDCEDIAMAYNITSMPTFIFIKDHTVVEVLVGSNADELKKYIEKHAAVKSNDAKQDTLGSQDTERVLEQNLEEEPDENLQEHPISVSNVTVNEIQE